MGKGKRGDGHAREAARRQRAAARKPARAPAPANFDEGWARAYAAENPGVTIDQAAATLRRLQLGREARARPSPGADARARARRIGRDLERLEVRREVLLERAAVEVAALRAAGVSWREVGSMLGMSHVAALKRFGAA